MPDLMVMPLETAPTSDPPLTLSKIKGIVDLAEPEPGTNPFDSPHEETPVKTPGNPAETTADETVESEVALRQVVRGDTIRFASTHYLWSEQVPSDAVARCLLEWIATRYPDSVGKWVPYVDLENYLYPQFLEQHDCPKLSLRSIARQLGRITRKREKEFRSGIGGRRTRTEYRVPRYRRHARPVCQ